MKVQLTTYRTIYGGIKQVWRAFDEKAELFGMGRNRIAAIRDVCPIQQRLNEGRLGDVPADYESMYFPPAKQSERERRIPAWAE